MARIVLCKDYHKGAFIRGLKTVPVYDGEDKVMEATYYVRDDRGTNYLARLVNIYDSKGYLVEQHHYGQPGGRADTTRYINDAKGRHLQILYTNYLSNYNEYIYKKVLRTWHVSGTLLTEQEISTYQNSVDSGYVASYSYSHDEHNNWTVCVQYNKGIIDNIVLRNITYYK